MKKNLLVFIFLFSLAVFSQTSKPDVAQWKFYYESGNVQNEFALCFLVKLETGWHTYSQVEVNDGPIPTKITLIPSIDDFEIIGPVIEPLGEKKMDEAFGLEITSFEKEVKFTQVIKRKHNKNIRVKGSVEYMTCNSVQCNPPKTIPFEIEIP
ncbi:MAG: protein-disulfide reductase DsbD domain-containing protein [Bacteroidota bacterium]|jgi:DsbC/DsbD-like thiol-disulfide interchange protein